MILNATLQQMAFLFSLIIIGYLLMKLHIVPINSETVLSKLENCLFMPAIVSSTFITNFTVDKLESAGKLLLFSLVIEAIVIPVALIGSKLLTKDSYIRKIYLYSLCISNFGFMGNAVAKSIFPELFFDYLIFTIILSIVVYTWGIPSLLMESSGEAGIKGRLKNLLNPICVCMVLGMIIGLLEIKMPSFVYMLIDSTGACMSPVAMLITGMTIAKIDILSVLKNKSVYVISILRLLVFPLAFIGIIQLLPMDFPESYITCAVVSLAMPLGLNTVVIPSAYGKDTSIASGMALISHVMSIATIPFIFWLVSYLT